MRCRAHIVRELILADSFKHCEYITTVTKSWCENLRLREMEEELKYAPLPFRNQMMSKIRAYRRDLSMFQRELRSTDLGLGPGSQGDIKYGIFSTENEQSTHLQSQRVLLLQGTDSLNRASQSIERSHRIAAETDQIGTDIIEELGEQREQLERTKSRLVNTSENLSKSRKILRSMSRSSKSKHHSVCSSTGVQLIFSSLLN
uniref:Vesicle transport through interaction with t-SNAREs 1B n=2 Tax=Athene cunicularia TaxID=194338 RepID=A0A663MP97_ATHCN